MRDEAMAKRLSEELAGSSASSHTAQANDRTADDDAAPVGHGPSDAGVHAHGEAHMQPGVGTYGYADEAARRRQEAADEAFARKLMEDGTPEKAPDPGEGGEGVGGIGGMGEHQDDRERPNRDAREEREEDGEGEDESEEEDEEEVVVVAERGVAGDVPGVQVDAEVEVRTRNGGVQADGEGEGWDCPSCTFHNSQFSTSMECEMCGTAMHGEGAASPTKGGDVGAGAGAGAGVGASGATVPPGASGDVGLGPTSSLDGSDAHLSTSLPPPPGKVKMLDVVRRCMSQGWPPWRIAPLC